MIPPPVQKILGLRRPAKGTLSKCAGFLDKGGKSVTKLKWKRKIIEQCQAVGTYREPFLPVIETLAATLEQRDKTRKEFDESGAQSVVAYTNKFGATNYSKNPLLVLWDELNKSALAYWRDLGLTPAGLKKIDEKAMQPKKRSALAEALSSLGD